MSITVLEAMALEKPVVVAKSIGPSEFINNEKNGLLVEPNIDGLFNGIKQLLEDNQLYNELCCDHRELLEQYSSYNIINKIYEII